MTDRTPVLYFDESSLDSSPMIKSLIEAEKVEEESKLLRCVGK